MFPFDPPFVPFRVKRRYITHDGKGISKFSHTVSQSFMITTRVCLSHFEKMLINKTEARRSRKILTDFLGVTS